MPRSCAEIEYRTTTLVTSELISLKQLLKEFKFEENSQRQHYTLHLILPFKRKPNTWGRLSFDERWQELNKRLLRIDVWISQLPWSEAALIALMLAVPLILYMYELEPKLPTHEIFQKKQKLAQ